MVEDDLFVVVRGKVFLRSNEVVSSIRFLKVLCNAFGLVKLLLGTCTGRVSRDVGECAIPSLVLFTTFEVDLGVFDKRTKLLFKVKLREALFGELLGEVLEKTLERLALVLRGLEVFGKATVRCSVDLLTDKRGTLAVFVRGLETFDNTTVLLFDVEEVFG